MPGPDPDGVEVKEYGDGTFSIWANCFSDGNRRHRLARMRKIAWNLRRGGWRCVECADPVPIYRRADAEYCGEQCRKRAARRRRDARRHMSIAPPKSCSYWTKHSP